MDAVQILQSIGQGLKVVEDVVKTKPYGPIIRQAEITTGGIQGCLVWDKIVWNEITFEDTERNKTSLFNSASKEETEKEWKRLIDQFGK